MTITEFLLARTTDTIADARYVQAAALTDSSEVARRASRLAGYVVAECYAKRKIIELAEASPYLIGQKIMRFLALSYTDHPDYRQEWKP